MFLTNIPKVDNNRSAINIKYNGTLNDKGKQTSKI